jgi:hypothetical protein
VPLAFLAQDQRLLKCNLPLQKLLRSRGIKYAGRPLRDVLAKEFNLRCQADDGALIQSGEALQSGTGEQYRVHLIKPPALEVADVPVQEVAIFSHRPKQTADSGDTAKDLRGQNQELEQHLVELSTQLALLQWALENQSHHN